MPNSTGNNKTDPVPEDHNDATSPAGGEERPPSDYTMYRRIHATDPPLEDCLDEFWGSSGVPGEQDAPSCPPEPYEILKRLGPSPFADSSFPLIGFFATAYERVSRFARERVDA